MTNLISLRLNDCEFIKTIDIGLWLTKLVSLSLNSNSQINGSALAKLICLRKLNLDNNTCISDLDIESLPLESLSLVGNYRITDSIFRKLKLTQVGLSVGSPAATDEILRCTTITDLNLKGTNMDYICYIPTFAKMTNLRKLIAVDYYSTEDVFKYLTNLTYLELPYSGNDRGIDVGIAGLPLLGTLVIDKIYDRYFPKVPLDSLSHLEIRGDRYKINLQFVRNLTFLDVGPGWINQELHDLKNLKKLVLRNVGYCCDISRLSELTSLTVLDDTSKHCVINHSLFVSDSLQSLCIHAYRCFMYGASFRAVPNLKYLSVCALDVRIDSSSFNNLDKLFSIVVREHQVDKKLLASLRKEGIMVRDSFYMGPGEPRYSDFFDKLA
ncbi:MAG: hypothetical protein Hyperionvirus5_76 [Hyperionvirus sp.]|uniref:Leucine-rich repeat protein n=1 Tax=Hyperionvirus sp. TaxID=2487770 RepID=A0A3G5A7L9_9VIRU|nr:MAG: hypothetical protein Hyperionvirus5_76 [Hyperionvirus sp.]